MPEVNGKKYPYTAKGKTAAKKAEDKQGSAAWRRDQLLEARDLSMEEKGKADGVRYRLARGDESRNARTAMQREKARDAKKAALKASLKK
jgi:hypothetical protein